MLDILKYIFIILHLMPAIVFPLHPLNSPAFQEMAKDMSVPSSVVKSVAAHLGRCL